MCGAAPSGAWGPAPGRAEIDQTAGMNRNRIDRFRGSPNGGPARPGPIKAIGLTVSGCTGRLAS